MYDDLNADNIPVHDSEILRMSCGSTESDACELIVTCKPHYNVRIFGACIVCEARTIECYSKTEGYIQSCRGDAVVAQDLNENNEEPKELYHSRLKLENPESEISLKFLSTEDRTKFRIHKMKFVLLQDQDDQSYMKSNIDLSKVKGYLHSMGNSVPENALELLNSVEQYQKTQMSGLQDIQNMFAGLNMGPAGDNGLSNLLSVVSKLGPLAKDQHKLDSETNMEAESESSFPLVTGHANMKPLANLARTLSQGEGHTDIEGQGPGDDNMLYKMLQNICGSVSKMRDVDTDQNEDGGNQADDDMQPNPSTSHTEEQTETSAGVTRMTSEDIQTAIQETVSQIFSSTEQRLKDYIDTSLNALEDRINQKLDLLLQKQGYF